MGQWSSGVAGGLGQWGVWVVVGTLGSQWGPLYMPVGSQSYIASWRRRGPRCKLALGSRVEVLALRRRVLLSGFSAERGDQRLQCGNHVEISILGSAGLRPPFWHGLYQNGSTQNNTGSFRRSLVHRGLPKRNRNIRISNSSVTLAWRRAGGGRGPRRGAARAGTNTHTAW